MYRGHKDKDPLNVAAVSLKAETKLIHQVLKKTALRLIATSAAKNRYCPRPSVTDGEPISHQCCVLFHVFIKF